MKIDPDGIDLGWFALDQDGHVGFFVSGGSRVIPDQVLASKENLDFLDRSMKNLPVTGKGVLRGSWGGNRKHWIGMSARGLFAYDFVSQDANNYEKGDYKLVAEPSQPLVLDRSDGEIVQALLAHKMPGVCFAKKKVLEQNTIRPSKADIA